jgi:metal-responsive CopG/Arc/MetJ family transcriptional regulator
MPSAFDAEVAKVLQRNPHLTRSAAIDHALTTPIGKRAWEAQKAEHAAAVAKAMHGTDVVGEQPGDEDERADAAHQFNRIVDGLQRQHQCSRSEAMTRALKTREGQEAFSRWKAA